MQALPQRSNDEFSGQTWLSSSETTGPTGTGPMQASPRPSNDFGPTGTGSETGYISLDDEISYYASSCWSILRDFCKMLITLGEYEPPRKSISDNASKKICTKKSGLSLCPSAQESAWASAGGWRNATALTKTLRKSSDEEDWRDWPDLENPNSDDDDKKNATPAASRCHQMKTFSMRPTPRDSVVIDIDLLTTPLASSSAVVGHNVTSFPIMDDDFRVLSKSSC